jgi:hypothetical protein
MLRWLLTINVCGNCAVVYAIAVVEFEGGREWHPVGEPCARTDQRGRTCRHIKDLHWPERPPRQGVPK